MLPLLCLRSLSHQQRSLTCRRRYGCQSRHVLISFRQPPCTDTHRATPYHSADVLPPAPHWYAHVRERLDLLRPRPLQWRRLNASHLPSATRIRRRPTPRLRNPARRPPSTTVPPPGSWERCLRKMRLSRRNLHSQVRKSGMRY